MSKSSKNGKWPVYVDESPLHGKGLFAAKDIPNDTLIIPVVGKPTDEDGIYVLWWTDKSGDVGFEVTNEARFVNHSAKPNAAYYEDGVWSIRKIKKGEEITHHYGDAWKDLD